MENGGFMRSCTVDRSPSLTIRLKQYAWDKVENCNLDLAGQCWFLSGLGVIAGFGVFVAIPFLYGEDSVAGSAMTVFGYFLATEILINWICIKTTDSTYNPSRHGTQPDNIEIGEDYTQRRVNEEYGNGSRLKSETFTSLRKDATTVPVSFGNEQTVSHETSQSTTVYPYFSWKPCLRCNRPRPPRSYHCPVCDRCILKRDHHCFVTGTCIGYHNIRHFTVMLFWATVATIFAGVHALLYFYYEILPHTSIFDLFFPLALLRCLVFRISLKHMLLIFVGWSLLGFFIWSVGFFRRSYKIVTTSLTSYEQWEHIRLYDSKPLDKKVEAVFGKMWWVNLIVPIHFIYKPIDDPVNWPTISTLKLNED